METTSIMHNTKTHYRLWRRPALFRIPKHTTGYGDDQHNAEYQNTLQVMETTSIVHDPKHTTGYGDVQHCARYQNTLQVMETTICMQDTKTHYRLWKRPALCTISKHITGYGDDQHYARYQNTLQVMETTS